MAATVAALKGENSNEMMLRMLPVAKTHAHPPISNYFVGAVARGSSGTLYLGQNIEIPGNMLGLAVHAEQSAIANAYMAGEAGVEAIAVTAAPCGHCRQFLSEVSLDMTMRVLVAGQPTVTIAELLPRAFGPKNLGMSKGAFPVVQRSLTLQMESKDALVLAALKATCGSYSPYSKSPSGVAVETSDGRIFAGSYIENAAFNPSLPPLETALAGYYAAGSGAVEIRRCVLVEQEGAAISHLTTTRSVLATIAPKAAFELVSVKG